MQDVEAGHKESIQSTYEMQRSLNMRGWDFVPNVDVKKCQKMCFLMKNGPSGRFPRCKMASKYIPDQFPTIPHQYPYQKHPKSTKIDQNRWKIKKIEQKINFFALAWGLAKDMWTQMQAIPSQWMLLTRLSKQLYCKLWRQARDQGVRWLIVPSHRLNL